MNVHDVLRVPVHDCVLEVEPLQICHRGRFNLFRESEGATNLDELRQIEPDEQQLLRRIQELYGRR